ncbi:MAG: hypothetical protein COV52_08210 [Gammaproteobacteria bacterium CG11_big_fil_rev_8_21_14_0_20_46_22]|nr:MAG: hypothetical protein COW05_06215 [Gammaproteobacteria bacterium CG12_big_fil_rev_8_21_14_0_65_46_12]PIR10590.1 MAG: hypothetical protein COV52_08210 [Gammaproteobacteria bacterium CG11_big_fil_rev_8_21_14_0_20_46_22]
MKSLTLVFTMFLMAVAFVTTYADSAVGARDSEAKSSAKHNLQEKAGQAQAIKSVNWDERTSATKAALQYKASEASSNSLNQQVDTQQASLVL